MSFKYKMRECVDNRSLELCKNRDARVDSAMWVVNT